MDLIDARKTCVLSSFSNLSSKFWTFGWLPMILVILWFSPRSKKPIALMLDRAVLFIHVRNHYLPQGGKIHYFMIYGWKDFVSILVKNEYILKGNFHQTARDSVKYNNIREG